MCGHTWLNNRNQFAIDSCTKIKVFLFQQSPGCDKGTQQQGSRPGCMHIQTKTVHISSSLPCWHELVSLVWQVRPIKRSGSWCRSVVQHYARRRRHAQGNIDAQVRTHTLAHNCAYKQKARLETLKPIYANIQKREELLEERKVTGVREITWCPAPTSVRQLCHLPVLTSSDFTHSESWPANLTKTSMPKMLIATTQIGVQPTAERPRPIAQVQYSPGAQNQWTAAILSQQTQFFRDSRKRRGKDLKEEQKMRRRVTSLLPRQDISVVIQLRTLTIATFLDLSNIVSIPPYLQHTGSRSAYANKCRNGSKPIMMRSNKWSPLDRLLWFMVLSLWLWFLRWYLTRIPCMLLTIGPRLAGDAQVWTIFVNAWARNNFVSRGGTPFLRNANIVSNDIFWKYWSCNTYLQVEQEKKDRSSRKKRLTKRRHGSGDRVSIFVCFRFVYPLINRMPAVRTLLSRFALCSRILGYKDNLRLCQVEVKRSHMNLSNVFMVCSTEIYFVAQALEQGGALRNRNRNRAVFAHRQRMVEAIAHRKRCLQPDE